MEQMQWLTRALEGDRTARAHLFEENIQPIYYLCWKLTGSAAQAGELTRRTFARAFSHLEQIRPDTGFDRWVTVIAVNLCRQSLKKSQPWLFTTDEREMALLRDTYVADEECLPPDCLNVPEQRSLALRTIGLLPPEQRICMVLRYVALLKPHQIAKLMDVDEMTVLGRLNSGRRALMTTLPCAAPQAHLTELFLQEAAALPVPELLRGSCMQTVLSTRPEPEDAPAPEPEPAAEEEAEGGLFANLSKKQKYLLYGGGGLALFLVILLLILALRGCGAKKPEDTLPKPEDAPVEEVDEHLESAALLDEYGIEVLLTYSRRDAEALVEDWQSVLPEYISTGLVDDLALQVETANDEVTEVRLSLEKTELDITRLRKLGLGVQPELDGAAKAIKEAYGLACYGSAPLFDPVPRASDSMAAYSENYRYELKDSNGDGRAELLSITRVGAGFDAKQGIFCPYGESLTELIGLRREAALTLFGEGDYDGDNVDRYLMAANGAAADGSSVLLCAVMEARSEMDAARQSVSALTMEVDGCFAELLPELRLPDAALTLTQLNRKLQSLDGHIGALDGDVFSPMTLQNGEATLYYYTDATRYLFFADSEDSAITRVELLDLSDCRLWDARSQSFRPDGFDLEKLLGMDRYEAYSEYGIRSYNLPNATALGLWEADGIIRTVYNKADPRALWGLRPGDSRDTVEAKVEKADGYSYAEEDAAVRYVLPGKRELAVTYDGSKVAVLQLEDHSHQADYKVPEPAKQSPQALFAAFLPTLSDVKASWYGDLTHDGTGDLLVCRTGGSGCLLQLYVIKDDAVSTTPIYTKTIAASATTDVYVVSHDSGSCLLTYTLSEAVASNSCSWSLLSINAAGGEVVLGQNEAKVNLLDLLLEGQEEFDAVKQEAENYCRNGKYLCGTQSGTADFSGATADLSE